MTIAEDRSTTADMEVFEPRRPAPRPDIVDVERFHSPEIFKREMVKLWGKVWQIGCLASEIPNPGDYYEYVVGEWSFLIVRATGGELKAYHNVCHHRGRKVKTGTGNASAPMCIYHGWTWNPRRPDHRHPGAELVLPVRRRRGQALRGVGGPVP
jgi:nitrite reductase/ring-hydroxylating ferredoxin subunit